VPAICVKGLRPRRATRALSGQGRSNTAWDQLLSRSAPGSADITRFAGCRNRPKATFRAEVDGRPCQPSAGIREMTGADPSGNPQVSLRFGAESRFLGPPEAPVTRRCRAISTSRPAADPRTRPYLTPRPDQPTRRPHPTAERAQYNMIGCSALTPRPFWPFRHRLVGPMKPDSSGLRSGRKLPQRSPGWLNLER